jgi:hypothetical protein
LDGAVAGRDAAVVVVSGGSVVVVSGGRIVVVVDVTVVLVVSTSTSGRVGREQEAATSATAASVAASFAPDLAELWRFSRQ